MKLVINVYRFYVFRVFFYFRMELIVKKVSKRFLIKNSSHLMNTPEKKMYVKNRKMYDSNKRRLRKLLSQLGNNVSPIIAYQSFWNDDSCLDVCFPYEISSHYFEREKRTVFLCPSYRSAHHWWGNFFSLMIKAVFFVF